jgi:hypothetical protein
MRTTNEKRDFEVLNMRLTPELYRTIQEAARAEGLPTSSWARRQLILVLAGESRKKKNAA